MKDHESVYDSNLSKNSVSFIDIKSKNKSKGESNQSECDAIVKEIQNLKKSKNVLMNSITILTPYRKQKELLKQKIIKISKEIIIKTVDEYQGEENDIILLSISFSGSYPSSFLCDERRINVMTSRARKRFVLYGNLSILQNRC